MTFVPPGEPLPCHADLVILPGSKSTIADLAFFRAQGWDIDLAAHVRRGGHVLGLCGGYQMLGRRVVDADGLEGTPGESRGLGLLDIETVLAPAKTLALRDGRDRASGQPVAGYEIHLGRTEGPDCARPMLDIAGRGDGASDGATSPDGRIAGCYLHGLFASDSFRASFLAGLGAPPSDLAYAAQVERTLDALADHVAAAVDLDRILAIARAQRGSSAAARTASSAA